MSLTATALVDQAIASLRTRGHGEEDHSALLRYVEELAGNRIGGTE